MKKSVLFLIPAVLMMVVSACSPSREKQVSRIDNLEKRLFSPEAFSFDKAKADSLIALYEAFIEKYPDDSLSPGYLFKAANIAMNVENPAKSIAFFDQYITRYPDKPKAPMCLFFKAFVYENQLHDLEKARETYLLFIEKYPTHEFASQSQLALMNLGKSPEMLVQEFEERQRADSIRIADSLKKAAKSGRRK